MIITPETIARFKTCYEEKGPDECWEWKRGKAHGYGRFYPVIPGNGVIASRFALAVKLGGSIPDGMHSLHSCDNPGCVNPNHLSAGTNHDNVLDAVRKKRNSRPPINDKKGENHAASKLTSEQVKRVMWDRISGISLAKIAAAIPGISMSNIQAICDGRSWSHAHGTNGFPTTAQLMEAKSTLSVLWRTKRAPRNCR